MSSAQHDLAVWQCKITVAKFWGAIQPDSTPYAVDEYEHNMLLHGGVSNLWQYLLGNGTTTAGQVLTYFNGTNTAIGVGDSTTAAAATQTDLQATTNRLRKGQNAGYPEHTAGVTSTAKTIRFRSTFDTGEANFAWQEAGVFNSATQGTGRMLNRKVVDMGTKTSASSFQITFDIAID